MSVVETRAPKMSHLESHAISKPKKKIKKPKSAINDLSEKVVSLLLTMSLDDLEEKLHKRKLQKQKQKQKKLKKKEFDYDNKSIFVSPGSNDTETFNQSKESIKTDSAKSNAPTLEKTNSARQAPEKVQLGPTLAAPSSSSNIVTPPVRQFIEHNNHTSGPNSRFPTYTSVEQTASDKPLMAQRTMTHVATVSASPLPAPLPVTKSPVVAVPANGTSSFPGPAAPPAVLDANTQRSSIRTYVEVPGSSSTTPTALPVSVSESSSRRSSGTSTTTPSVPQAPDSSRRNSATKTVQTSENTDRQSANSTVKSTETVQRRSSPEVSVEAAKPSTGSGQSKTIEVVPVNNSEPTARKSSMTGQGVAETSETSNAQSVEKRKSGPGKESTPVASFTPPTDQSDTSLTVLTRKVQHIPITAPPVSTSPGSTTRKSPPLPAAKAGSKVTKKAAKKEVKSDKTPTKVASSSSSGSPESKSDGDSSQSMTTDSNNDQDDDPILRHILESLDDPEAMYDLLDNPEYVERLEQLILSTPTNPNSSNVPMANGKPIFRGMTRRHMQNAAQVMWGRLSRISEGENEDSDSATLSTADRNSEVDSLTGTDVNDDDEDEDDVKGEEDGKNSSGTSKSDAGTKTAKSTSGMKIKGPTQLHSVRNWIRKRHAKNTRMKEKKHVATKVTKVDLSTIEEDDAYSDIDEDELTVPIRLNKSLKSPNSKPSSIAPETLNKEKESTKKLRNVKKWLYNRSTGAKQAELQKQALLKIQQQIKKRREDDALKAQQVATLASKTNASRPPSKVFGSVPSTVKPSAALNRSSTSSMPGARSSGFVPPSRSLPKTPVAAAAVRVGSTLPGVSGVKLINSKVPVVISAVSVVRSRFASNKNIRKIVKVGKY